jgi:hypothetical protein
MPSATVPDQYESIGAILDPPYFSLDTTFKYTFYVRNQRQLFFPVMIQYRGTLKKIFPDRGGIKFEKKVQLVLFIGISND